MGTCYTVKNTTKSFDIFYDSEMKAFEITIDLHDKNTL